jgi:hypothetical protein
MWLILHHLLERLFEGRQVALNHLHGIQLHRPILNRNAQMGSEFGELARPARCESVGTKPAEAEICVGPICSNKIEDLAQIRVP